MKKFECPRVCYDTQDDFKVLGIEKATTDEDNEEGTLRFMRGTQTLVPMGLSVTPGSLGTQSCRSTLKTVMSTIIQVITWKGKTVFIIGKMSICDLHHFE